MNLDFRKLKLTDRVKAIDNIIKLHDKEFLAYVIANEQFDVYSWFALNDSKEGFDYWYKIKNEQKQEV
jgi:hypothetical protein